MDGIASKFRDLAVKRTLAEPQEQEAKRKAEERKATEQKENFPKGGKMDPWKAEMMQMLQQVVGCINEDLQALRGLCFEAYEHQDSQLNKIDERITNLESNTTRAASADEAKLKVLIQEEMKAIKPDGEQRSHSVPLNPSKVA